MDQDLVAKISQTYADHPLTAARLLQRVEQRRGNLAGITEIDFAEDSESFLTDQNHLGGLKSVRELAAELNVRPGTTVLDIGAGLGGPARLLAHEYGCRCHGVELTRVRYEDALRLTQLVSLGHLVSFTHGDFLEVTLPQERYDVVLGLGSFNHFPDLAMLLRRCRKVLQGDGQLSIGEAYLHREPADGWERESLEALFDCWNGRSRTQATWLETLSETGFTVDDWRDATECLSTDLAKLLDAQAAGRMGSVSKLEIRAWQLAQQLSERKLLGYFRLRARMA